MTRREALLRQIGGIGPFIEGTLVKLPRKDCRHVAHRLTFKVQVKTRAVYVPLDRVRDVEQWTRQYKRLKRLVRSVTEVSLQELRNHVRARRAAVKAGRTRKTAAKHLHRGELAPQKTAAGLERIHVVWKCLQTRVKTVRCRGKIGGGKGS